MFGMTTVWVTVGMAGLLLASPMLTEPAAACSRILWNTNKQAVIVARSMDWSVPFGDRLVRNPRGISMQGWVGTQAATWVSRYGSVVVVPYEFSVTYQQKIKDDQAGAKAGDPLVDGSSEGMNEKGLAVHLLYLGATKHGEQDTDKPLVHPARLLRYVLDNFASVSDAVAALENIQIVPGSPFPEHMAMDDATGDSAIIEFIENRMEVHHGRQYTVLTNDPIYSAQMENLKRYKAFGGTLEELPGGIEPSDRFVRAAAFLQTLPEPRDKTEAVAYLKSVIRNVSVPFGAVYRSLPASSTYPTWWTSISDLTNRIFYFHMTCSLNGMWVTLRDEDFAAGKPIRVLDPRQADLVGDVTHKFEPATTRTQD
ncbi:MAG: linear amide C-N hydrolase [Solidesulfovibrio sp. DCME]|uniref:linear amide C-N hydrolase n=1 Tax=Solidesulfovibrio sp. DCME TaxID=3447380 RepID=UPI003D09A707